MVRWNEKAYVQFLFSDPCFKQGFDKCISILLGMKRTAP